MSVKKTISAIVLALFVGSVEAASLYQEGSFQSLTSDRKAHKIGDLLTVMVYENSSASSTANTSTERNSGVNLGLSLPATSKSAGFKSDNQLDGRGRTQREGRVLAQLTVFVKAIAENGDLLVAGEQFLEVNNERQQIQVEGRVRLQDISETNTVLSTRLADAKIRYVGDGDLADHQRPGWWQRVLTWFGL